MNKFFKLAVAIGLSELAGVVGSIFTTPAISSGWYATLQKPALNPPNWVFGPVWTTLFAFMGIALFLVWNRHSLVFAKGEQARLPASGGNERMMRMWKLAMFIFAFQLSLNIFWSMMFFGLESPAGACAVILSLWLAILAAILAFWKISRAAAWLFVPYILWVSFAAYLNYSIWMLN